MIAFPCQINVVFKAIITQYFYARIYGRALAREKKSEMNKIMQKQEQLCNYAANICIMQLCKK